MRLVEFVPFRLTEIAEIFTIKINGKESTEAQEFIIAFKDTDNAHLHSDIQQILKTIEKNKKNGAKESFFRPEGKIKD